MKKYIKLIIILIITIVTAFVVYYFVFNKETMIKRPVVNLIYGEYDKKNYSFKYDIKLFETKYVKNKSKIGTRDVKYSIDGWKIYKLDSNGDKEYNGNKYTLLKDNVVSSSYSSNIEIGKKEDFMVIAYKKELESEPFIFTVDGDLDVVAPIELSLVNGEITDTKYSYTLKYNIAKKDEEHFDELDDEYKKAIVSTKKVDLEKYVVWEKYESTYDNDNADLKSNDGFYNFIKEIDGIEEENVTFQRNRGICYLYRYYIVKENGEKVYSDNYKIPIDEAPAANLSCTLVRVREVEGKKLYTYRFRIENADSYKIKNQTGGLIHFTWQLSSTTDDETSEEIQFYPVRDNILIDEDYFEEDLDINIRRVYDATASLNYISADGLTRVKHVLSSSNECVIWDK